MPSSKNYVRDTAQEYKTSVARGDEGVGPNSPHAKRKRLRRLAVKRGLVKPNDGKDLAHKIALSKRGPNTLKNATVQSPSKNRSFARNPDGSMK
jgi:hypothetical protein